jgi:hypothetical protein
MDRCKTDGKLKPIRESHCVVGLHRRAHGAVQGWATDARGCRCRRRRECAADLRDSCAGCCAGTGGNGVHGRCQLLFRMRWLLPNRVHRPVQDGWQVETGSRVTLCGRSASPYARWCARMRTRCMRLSVRKLARGLCVLQRFAWTQSRVTVVVLTAHSCAASWQQWCAHLLAMAGH